MPEHNLHGRECLRRRPVGARRRTADAVKGTVFPQTVVESEVLASTYEVLPNVCRLVVLPRADILFRVPERRHARLVVHCARVEALYVDGVVAGDLLVRQHTVVEANGVDFALPSVVRRHRRRHNPAAEREHAVAGAPVVDARAAVPLDAIAIDIGHIVVFAVRRHKSGRHVRLHLDVRRRTRLYDFRAPVEVGPDKWIGHVAMVKYDIPRPIARPEHNARVSPRLLKEHLDRLVQGRGGLAERRRLAARSLIHAEPDAPAPCGAVRERQVVVAGQVLPCRRGRNVHARALVVDAVVLTNKAVLHVAQTRKRRFRRVFRRQEPRLVDRAVLGDLRRRQGTVVKADGENLTRPWIILAERPVADSNLLVACAPGISMSNACLDFAIEIEVADRRTIVSRRRKTHLVRIMRAIDAFGIRRSIKIEPGAITVKDDESRIDSAVEQNSTAGISHPVNDFDRFVGGRRARALRTRATAGDLQRVAVERPRTFGCQSHVEVADEVFPYSRVRVVRSRTRVVDAVPLRDQPALHVA